MSDTVGEARIDMVLNIEDFRVGTERARSLVTNMGGEFQKHFNSMGSASKRATKEALLLAQTYGKTADEIKLLTLAARGAAPEAIEKLAPHCGRYSTAFRMNHRRRLIVCRVSEMPESFERDCPRTWVQLVELIGGRQVREVHMEQAEDAMGPLLRIEVVSAERLLVVESREPWLH